MKSLYGTNNSVSLFADYLTEWLLDAGFIKSQCHMSIYFKYAPYGTKIVVIYYFDDCFYWYTSEALGKLLVDALGKIFYMNLLGYAHWFMLIRIYQMMEHYI